MSVETPPENTAAPATQAPATQAAPAQQPAADTTTTQQPAQPAAFKVPDAYKEKPWASKIKSEEDVYKQLDNLDTLVGKKTAVPDFKTATPEDIAAYFDGLKPADKAEYKFADSFKEDVRGSVADMLYEAGIAAPQAEKLLPLYEKFESKRLEEATSADGFKEVMTKSFGEKYDASVAAVATELKQRLSADDAKMLDTIPNEYIGLVYRLTKSMQDAYGAKEKSSAHTDNKNASVSTKDWKTQASENRAKIRELDGLPHSEDQIAKLVAENDKLYKDNFKG